MGSSVVGQRRRKRTAGLVAVQAMKNRNPFRLVVVCGSVTGTCPSQVRYGCSHLAGSFPSSGATAAPPETTSSIQVPCFIQFLGSPADQIHPDFYGGNSISSGCVVSSFPDSLPLGTALAHSAIRSAAKDPRRSISPPASPTRTHCKAGHGHRVLPGRAE